MEQNFASSDLDLVERLALNLAQLMKAQGLSQPQLAQKSGVGQTTISLYLNPARRLAGKSGKVPSPKLAEVDMLARALGVDAGALLRSAGSPPPAPPRNFADRNEVSETDWGLLQDVHLVMTDQELDELRARAQHLRRKVHEQLETVAAGSETRPSERIQQDRMAPSKGARKHTK